MRRRNASLSFAHAVLIAVAVQFLLYIFVQGTESQGSGELPPVRTEVKYVENKEKRIDDPQDAWEEWGETAETKKNPFPKRQREIKAGMDINTIMGMAMKQPKVVTAVLTEEFGSSQAIGQMTTTKFRNQMAAAGIGCKLWFVPQGRQVIANCETIRDGHMAKDYMLLQSEIMRTVIDNIPFTPKPRSDDDDDDDDDCDDCDDDEDDNHKVSRSELLKNNSAGNKGSGGGKSGETKDDL